MPHRALIEAKRRADLASEIAQVGHWRLDAATNAISWSDQVFRMFGLEPGPEPALEAAMAMLHPDDRQRQDELLCRAVQHGEAYTTTARVVWPSGEQRHLEALAISETRADGSVDAVFGVMIDVTDQVRAREAIISSEASYRVLADNIADVVMKGAGEIISYVSPSCRRYGYEPEELIGRAGHEIVHPDDLPMLSRLVAETVGGAALNRGCFRMLAKNGAWVWMEGNFSVLRDGEGKPREVISLLRDVSERMALEERLRKARDQARAAAKAKAEFLANMSHEIRTPLTAILGYTNLLAQRPDLGGELRDQIGQISSAGRALLAIVNDILDLSKFEAGETTLKPRPTAPADLVIETLDLFRLQADAKRLALEAVLDRDLPAQMHVDPDRVRQIIVNLVGNAVKFTDCGSVTVTCSYEAASGRLRLEVRDTGPGMSKAQQSKLFQRFSQLDGSIARKHGGTGLGLAICRALADAMGGEIGVASKLGRGSAFHFWIPAPLVTGDDEAVIAKSVANLPGARVLVVDDNPTNRQLARAFLEAFGAEVTLADSGASAIECAARAPFDAILMDVRMPGLDGPAVAARIRSARGPNQSAPILAFTADVQAELDSDGEVFDGVVRKPIVPAELAAAIASRMAAQPPAGSRARLSERRRATG